MKFNIEVDVAPSCEICQFAEFSERIKCDTVYCNVSGAKTIAGDPCEKFFLYNFVADVLATQKIKIEKVEA